MSVKQLDFSKHNLMIDPAFGGSTGSPPRVKPRGGIQVTNALKRCQD